MTAESNESLGDIVDFANYPLADIEFRQRCRSSLDATGVLETDSDNDGYPDTEIRDRAVDDQAAILGEPQLVTHSEPGTPTTPEPFCTTVFAGSESVMKICDQPTRVNWKSLQ